MRKLIIFTSIIITLTISANAAENKSPNPIASPTPSSEKVKKPAFRATKEQIIEAQKMLKDKGIYAGEADGKMNPQFRAAVKNYQKDNGLRQSGSLNRATLEKMGISLTVKQKEIPVNPNDLSSGETNTKTTKKRGAVFRASKEQILDAQKKLKEGGFYSGEPTGKLDPVTRESLKKYQTANGIRVTGTLNAETLEKMGIPLTDKQKEIVANSQ